MGLAPRSLCGYATFGEVDATETMGESEQDQIDADLRSAVRSALRGRAEQGVAAIEAAQRLRRTFHAELAAALEPRLNTHLQSLPQHSCDDKRRIATWTNGALRELGLAIRCPVTGRAARLLADYRDDGSRESRFRLEVSGPDGRKKRSYTGTTLPHLSLRESPPREEGLTRWNEKGRSR